MNIKELMRRLDELYTKQNSDLLNHISDNQIEKYDWGGNTRKHFSEWFSLQSQSDQVHISKKLMIDVEDLEIGKNIPPPWYEMISQMYTDSFVKFCVSKGEKDIFSPSADDLYKTSTSFELNSKKLLPRSTWLVHFTDYPKIIAEHGFTKGVGDKEKLALTTYLDDSEKESGGYNFAFLAYSTEAAKSANKSQISYGEHMVFFQSSGVDTWHKYDSEHQIIFWGKDIPPNTIVPVYRTSRNKFQIKNFNTDRVVFETREYSSLRKWIEQNYLQYKSTICCN